MNLEEQKACEGGIAYHANRIDTQEERAAEGGKEECHADTELPRINSRRTEVLNITQQQGGCGKQANNDGTQACEYRLYQMGVHILHEEFADEYHQYERGQDEGEGGSETAKHSHEVAIACVVDGCIAAIGS